MKNTDRHFNTEGESVDYFSNYLTDRNFTSVNSTQAMDKYCYYDISATNSADTQCRFELKNRGFASTKYGDIIIEEDKLNKFLQDKENGVYDCGVAVNFFTDGWCATNTSAPHKIIWKWAKKTTDFDCKEYVWKRFASYKQGKVHSYAE